MLPGDTPFRINSCLHAGTPNHAAGRNAVQATHANNTATWIRPRLPQIRGGSAPTKSAINIKITPSLHRSVEPPRNGASNAIAQQPAILNFWRILIISVCEGFDTVSHPTQEVLSVRLKNYYLDHAFRF